MKVQELDGDDWLDEGHLSAEEKAMLEARLAEHERNPGAAIPWSRFEARPNPVVCAVLHAKQHDRHWRTRARVP